jgi:general secretion pathway protein L
MTSDFYLFLPKRNNQQDALDSINLSWVYQDINNELKLAQGLLADAVRASAQNYITIVLPGEDVLFLKAEVPGKNIQRVRQAIPYVLEDSVIDDVDDLYFSINKENSEPNNKYNVAVVNKEYFESVIYELDKAGIQADTMTADYLLLADNNTLLFDGERVIFNGTNLKFSSSLESTINLNDLTEGEVVKLVYCNKESKENSTISKLTENIDFKEESCNANPLLGLIENSSNEKTINLLQGVYKKKKNWSKDVKTWTPIAVLFLVWLGIQGVLFVVDYISLSKQNKALNSEITKIYKNTFPKSRRIIDARAQMQSKLANLKKRKGKSGRSFTEMLSACASIFSKTDGLQIKSLRYYDGRINVDLQIASLQALDKLKNQLHEEKGYQVEIQNASSGKESVTARIQIMGAGS